MSEKAWGTEAAGLVVRSGFYARKFAGIDLGKMSLDDLHDLPFTTKQRPEGQPRGVRPVRRLPRRADRAGEARVFQTSGTTGKPS